MPDITNLNRANFAISAMQHFARETRMNGEDHKTVLTDLLADLRHAADRLGLDFDAINTSANSSHLDDISRGEIGYGGPRLKKNRAEASQPTIN
jgi:hypothetical protein